MSKSDSFLDHVASLIRRSDTFSAADTNCIRLIAEAAVWFSVPGGTPLFCQGEPSDAMFIVVSGLFGAYVRNEAGDETLVGRIGPGEVAGEMGYVTHEPRSATIRALRSSEVIAVQRGTLENLSRSYPAVLLSLCRTLIVRLRTAQARKPTDSRPRVFCLLPHIDMDDARTFANDFTATLDAFGPTVLVTKDEHLDHTAERLSALEAAHECVVYLAERGQTPWSRLCLRQADTVLVIARGGDAPNAIEPTTEIISPGIPVDLVLLWPGHILPARTAAWLDALRPRGHFHVRARPDVGRVARLLTGRGLGLVLSGGGARGLAHVGVARALAERAISIDVISGTSIGAFVGASIAMEWDFDAMRQSAQFFSRRHPLRELIPSRVSLLSGRNLRRALEGWFGELGIEETPIRYACVSTNLSMGSATAHWRGKLRTWLRASSALPGVFPPVLENGAIHVDGGVINNLPVDVIRDMGAGFVVAVDVGAVALAPGDPLGADGQQLAMQETRSPNMLEILMRVGTMSSDTRSLVLRQQCDLLLLPDVQRLGLLNWRAYDQAIEIGYRCTMDKIDQIEHRIREMQVASLSKAVAF